MQVNGLVLFAALKYLKRFDGLDGCVNEVIKKVFGN